MNLDLPPGGILLGLGCDIIEIDRVRGVFERQGERFLARVFTEEERTYCLAMKHPHKHIAARFAAKEAVSKCFTTGIGSELGWKSRLGLPRPAPRTACAPRCAGRSAPCARRRHEYHAYALAHRYHGHGRGRAGARLTRIFLTADKHG